MAIDPTDVDEHVAAAPEPLPRRSWPTAGARVLLAPMGVYLASRVLTLAAFALGSRLQDGNHFRQALRSWDGTYYYRIITDGYPPVLTDGDDVPGQTVHAFFPLFPGLVRLLSRTLGLHPTYVGLTLNVLLGAAFAVVLWLLVRRLVDEGTADRSVALVSFFPGSFVLSMLYAEVLLLLLVATCLYLLVERRWLLAGVAAALATATRPNALPLVAACAWAAGVAVVRRREWPALLAPALAPAGFLAFMAFLWARTGEADAWFRVQREGWGERFDFGAGTLERLGDVITNPSDVYLNVISASIGAVAIVVCAALLLQWRPPGEVAIYALGVALLALGSATLGGRPRFILTAFPLLIAVARVVKGSAHTALVGCCAVGLGCLSLLTATSLAITP